MVIEPIPFGEGATLTVLGCDGSYAGPGGASTGYLLRTPGSTVLLDAGPGTLGRLQRHVALADLDAVVVTHEHPDHCLELPVLRNALRYLLGIEGLRVITTVGTRDLVEHISEGAEPTFSWDAVAHGDERRVGDLRLRFTRTDHPVETLAVRVDHPGGSLAFTADTGPGLDGRDLDPDGSGVDVLLAEASLAPQYEGMAQHLSGRQAARLAVAAGARRLVVTHVAPGDDPATRRSEVVAALDGEGADVPVLLAADHQTPG